MVALAAGQPLGRGLKVRHVDYLYRSTFITPPHSGLGGPLPWTVDSGSSAPLLDGLGKLSTSAANRFGAMLPSALRFDHTWSVEINGENDANKGYGLLLDYKDSSNFIYLYWYAGGATYAIRKNEGGSDTQVVALSNGTTGRVRIWVVRRGPTFDVYRCTATTPTRAQWMDWTSLGSTTLSDATYKACCTGRIGIRNSSGSGLTHDYYGPVIVASRAS